MTATKIQLNCAYCGKIFEINEARLRHGRGKHCSPACQYATMRQRPRSNLIEKRCIGCGCIFLVSQSRMRHKGGGKYCTRSCRDIYWIGPATSNWQNADKIHNHGPNWHSARRHALKRDNNCCQRCGATSHLHVHHKIPGRLFASYEKANALDNLITLCDSCHRYEESLSRWVIIGDGIGGEDGSALRFTPNGVAWNLAKQAGLI